MPHDPNDPHDPTTLRCPMTPLTPMPPLRTCPPTWPCAASSWSSRCRSERCRRCWPTVPRAAERSGVKGHGVGGQRSPGWGGHDIPCGCAERGMGGGGVMGGDMGGGVMGGVTGSRRGHGVTAGSRGQGGVTAPLSHPHIANSPESGGGASGGRGGNLWGGGHRVRVGSRGHDGVTGSG